MNERFPALVDSATRYVRVTGFNPHGFVEFQFSIGDPALYLEMILPPTAFEEFCAMQRAVRLGDGSQPTGAPGHAPRRESERPPQPT
jgi:phenol hydroxylase P0 protein